MSHPDDASGAPVAATSPEQALHAACTQAGVDSRSAELIRLAENAIYRLPGHLVASVFRPGKLQTACRLDPWTEVVAGGWAVL
jgi:hypothetical protein